MTTGRPIATKCPACKRGKHGYPRQQGGVHRTFGVMQRMRKCFGGRRPGSVMRTTTHMTCVDCGHVWWTTLEGADR